MTPRAIEVSAILPLTEYVKVRAERRRQISEIKKNRRLEVGPSAAFYFESYETMLHQVHDIRVKNGRREFHSKEFLADEAMFEHYDEAKIWERRHLDALLTY